MILHPYKLTFIPLWLENAMARYGMKFSDAFDDKNSWAYYPNKI